MKKTILIMLAFALLVSSCKDETKQQPETIDSKVTSEQTETTSAEVITEEEVPDVPPIIQFDWTKIVALKNSTIKQLQKKAKSEDKIIMDFLNDKYPKVINHYNRILSKNKNFNFIKENLNNNSSENIDPRILSFIKDIEANGLGLYYGRVDEEVFLIQSSDFIKSGILPLINPISTEFINLYCHALDSTYTHEGICYVEIEDAVNRVYNWGELSKKVANLEYKESVEYEFIFYLHYLFYGGEHRPTWNDWDNNGKVKFSKYAIDAMNEIIKKYPTSRAAAEFKPFIELLKEENFECTENVENYRKLLWLGNHTSTIFKDSRDGKRYKTVKIGKQTWMAMNLDYAVEGSVCYDNDESNCQKYGRLYDWETAKQVCPAGWHLPTSDEWERLENIAGSGGAATKLKSKSWDGTDNYRFSALPGGYAGSDGNFHDGSTSGYWWSATEATAGGAWNRYMDSDLEDVKMENIEKSALFCVRCVKDN